MCTITIIASVKQGYCMRKWLTRYFSMHNSWYLHVISDCMCRHALANLNCLKVRPGELHLMKNNNIYTCKSAHKIAFVSFWSCASYVKDLEFSLFQCSYAHFIQTIMVHRPWTNCLFTQGPLTCSNSYWCGNNYLGVQIRSWKTRVEHQFSQRCLWL